MNPVTKHRLPLFALAGCIALGTGCSDDSSSDPWIDAGSDSGGPDAGPIAGGQDGGSRPDAGAHCTPDREVFDAQVAGVLQRRCGVCHSAEPMFGAPYTLTDYDALLEHDDQGRRKVDRVFTRLAAGTMPPPGNVRPPVPEFELLTSWASCGTMAPEYPTNLRASRQILQAPAEAPQGTTAVPLLADDFEVPLELDHYEDFFFEGVVDRDMFARRFDVEIDETAVIHHLTMHYDNPGDERYLYAWAPGTGAIEFPEGGLRIRPEDRFRVEVHYNNSRTLTDVRDSSGIVMYVAEPEGPDYAMLDPNTFEISVPGNSEASAVANCAAQSDFTIFAGLPHMHETGQSFFHELQRGDGSTETIIELNGWSFDLQYFYAMDVAVSAGDTMTITCNYRNPSAETVVGGSGTGDEMCYDFIYVTPADAALECDSPIYDGRPQ